MIVEAPFLEVAWPSNHHIEAVNMFKSGNEGDRGGGAQFQ